jgi:purine-binding chemotaxis protein CheW
MTAGGDAVRVRIGERRLAVSTHWVREVATVASVTPVPTAPREVAGLMQLRGQILPLLDLALAPSGPRPPRPGDPMLVVELGAARAGLLVDHVEGVGVGDEVERLDVAALFDRIRAEVKGWQTSLRAPEARP